MMTMDSTSRQDGPDDLVRVVAHMQISADVHAALYEDGSLALTGRAFEIDENGGVLSPEQTAALAGFLMEHLEERDALSKLVRLLSVELLKAADELEASAGYTKYRDELYTLVAGSEIGRQALLDHEKGKH